MALLSHQLVLKFRQINWKFLHNFREQEEEEKTLFN